MAWTSPRTWTTGEVVTATMLNAHIRDNFDAVNPGNTVAAVSWAPGLEATTTNPTTSSVSGRRWRVGPLQFVAARFVLDGLTAPVGTLFVTLPVAASGITGTGDSGSGQVIGGWTSRDNSATAGNEGGSVVLVTSTTVRFQRSVGGAISATSPFTWAENDVLSFHAVYPVA